MKAETTKRVFFGCEISAPWPNAYPKGRILDPDSRHLTLAFLGNIDFPILQSNLKDFPTPSFKVGLVGAFDKCLLLPKERAPHVVAWHVHTFHHGETLNHFATQFANWLCSYEYAIDPRPFLAHVTIARSPFNPNAWKNAFIPLPFFIKAIHLYESLGNLVYKPLWTYTLDPPFVELDHTADIAFTIQAQTMQDLHMHAQIALAFKFPSLLPYIYQISLKEDFNDIVIALNHLITLADSDIGCPFKAVSFHGKVEKNAGILSWKMIVDV